VQIEHNANYFFLSIVEMQPNLSELMNKRIEPQDITIFLSFFLFL